MYGRPALYRACKSSLIALAVVFVMTASTPASTERDEATRRAITTLAATEQWLGTKDGTGLYHDAYPRRQRDTGYSDEWPFSQVHIGVLDLAGALPSPEIGGALRAHDAAQMRYWADRSANGCAANIAGRQAADNGTCARANAGATFCGGAACEGRAHHEKHHCLLHYSLQL